MKVYVFNHCDDTEKIYNGMTEQEIAHKMVGDFPWLQGDGTLEEIVEHLDSTQMFSAEIVQDDPQKMDDESKYEFDQNIEPNELFDSLDNFDDRTKKLLTEDLEVKGVGNKFSFQHFQRDLSYTRKRGTWICIRTYDLEKIREKGLRHRTDLAQMQGKILKKVSDEVGGFVWHVSRNEFMVWIAEQRENFQPESMEEISRVVREIATGFEELKDIEGFGGVYVGVGKSVNTAESAALLASANRQSGTKFSFHIG